MIDVARATETEGHASSGNRSYEYSCRADPANELVHNEALPARCTSQSCQHSRRVSLGDLTYIPKTICRNMDMTRIDTQNNADMPPNRMNAPLKAQEVDEYMSLGVISL